MKKIISLFQRNYDGDRLVRDEVVPGADWVQKGEGIATRKWDGTCCLVRDGKLYRRYEVKQGGTPPANFEPSNDVDENTGKQQGWVPVSDGPNDRYHREAFTGKEPDGTYELIGPKVQGNAEGVPVHSLIPHGRHFITAPRDYEGLKSWFANHDVEGIVWWHGDGRMVKIKARDFGIGRLAAKEQKGESNDRVQ